MFSDVRSRRADVLAVCWASATDTVEGGASASTDII